MRVFLLIIVLVLLATMAYAGYSAAPWIPTWRKDALRMLHLAAVKKGELVVDLGCGDGRILFLAATQFEARGFGVEVGIPQFIHAWIVRLFQQRRNLVRLQLGNLFDADVSQADVVMVYLLPKSYPKLVKKLASELKPGTRVVVQAWPIKEWTPAKVDRPTPRHIPLYLYIV